MSEVKVITEENNKADIEEWFQQAKKQTLETLPEFIRHLMADYHHDYGTIVHAMTACAIATVWACDRTDQGGITGFQAGFLMWGFIRHWSFENNKTGLRILNYDDLLFPQYESKFDKTISPEVWECVQKQAREYLKGIDGKEPFTADSVVAHWKSIVDGKVPFGFTVKED